MRARTGGAVILAQEQLNRVLFGFDRVETGKEPHAHGDQQPDKDRAARQTRTTRTTARAVGTAATATAPAHQYAQLVLAFFHQFVDLRNGRAAVACGGTSATAISTSPTFTVARAVITATAAPRAARLSCHLFRFLLSLCPHRMRASYLNCIAVPEIQPAPYGQAVRMGFFMVTISSDMVGCTAQVRSKSSLVAPILTATPASWIISPAPGATI